jgi:hypothetical protein
MAISQDTRARVAAVWEQILDAVATCEQTLEQAAAHLAGVGIRSVQRYARETPGARRELDDALLDGAELSVARIPQLIMDTPDARRARILAEFAWKIAASRDPGRFGERSRVQLDVRTVDLTAIIRDANARLAAYDKGRVIEHETLDAITPSPDARALPAPSVQETLHSLL